MGKDASWPPIPWPLPWTASCSTDDQSGLFNRLSCCCHTMCCPHDACLLRLRPVLPTRRAAVPTTCTACDNAPPPCASIKTHQPAQPPGASGRPESAATLQLAGRQIVHATLVVAALTRANAIASHTTTQAQLPRLIFVALTQINRLCVAALRSKTSVCIMGTS